MGWSRSTGPIAKFRALDRRAQRLLIRSALAVALVRLVLATLPFRVVRRAVARLGVPRSPVPEGARPSVERISWAVAAAAARIPACGNCLVRALAAEMMLGRFGYPAQLRIGVGRTQAGEFEAHAWLESEGRVVLGQFALSRYIELAGPGASSL